MPHGPLRQRDRDDLRVGDRAVRRLHEVDAHADESSGAALEHGRPERPARPAFRILAGQLNHEPHPRLDRAESISFRPYKRAKPFRQSQHNLIAFIVSHRCLPDGTGHRSLVFISHGKPQVQDRQLSRRRSHTNRRPRRTFLIGPSCLPCSRTRTTIRTAFTKGIVSSGARDSASQ